MSLNEESATKTRRLEGTPRRERVGPQRHKGWKEHEEEKGGATKKLRF